MSKSSALNKRSWRGFPVILGVAMCLQLPPASCEGRDSVLIVDPRMEDILHEADSLRKRSQVTNNAYILGPGDRVRIELLNLEELSGDFRIGPDGNLYLPRLRALYVEGFTVEELREFLSKEYRKYVIDPQVYVFPVDYRPIRIYVNGEVKRPGFYTLTGVQNPSTEGNNSVSDGSSSATLFPTVFDAIRSAQGITPYSDLANIQVTRKRAQGLGGGRIRTNLNFISLVTEGDESQNIRLFDGDVVNVGKSNVVMREQLLKAGQSNLTPQFINVFVTGRVNKPGTVTIPHGSSLNHAIALAGGTRLLKGKVEFVRFTQEGEIDRRIFSYKAGASSDAQNNPLLSNGDLIHIKESALSTAIGVFNEIAAPAVGIYSAYSLFNSFSK